MRVDGVSTWTARVADISLHLEKSSLLQVGSPLLVSLSVTSTNKGFSHVRTEKVSITQRGGKKCRGYGKGMG